MEHRTQSRSGSAEASGPRERDRHTGTPAWTNKLGAAALLLAICALAALTNIDPPAKHSAARQGDPEPPAVRGASATNPQTVPVSESDCLDALRRAGIGFRAVPERRATGVAWPVMLTGQVDRVRIQGDASEAEASYLDCRLALALLAWAPQLRAQGVVGLQHYSIYRPDAIVAGSAKESGHARGLALDVASFEMRDGRKLSVQKDWQQHTRGADPCAEYPQDSASGRALRGIVCDAAERAVFQTVITPHYNDAHANHVHLEIGPPDRPFLH